MRVESKKSSQLDKLWLVDNYKYLQGLIQA